jgi:transposase
MLTVETIRKIRLAVHRDGKSIRQTAKDLHLSRNTVRKAIRSGETSFQYERSNQPRPKLGPFLEMLDRLLSEDEKLPKKLRRTAQILFEELQLKGYEGGYDSVRRYVQRWRQEQKTLSGEVFIPLVFEPGEAFQFDWSHEWVELDGARLKAKVAHLRLCHSRHFLCLAYPRETQEMVFDAHIRAFEFFGGVCRKGIYDNLKTVVNKILGGRERQFNSRFTQLSSHYLFEPLSCTPGAGWEKGQVENQVGLVRRRFFTPKIKAKDFKELNAILKEQCINWSKTHQHPTLSDKTIWEVYTEEKPYLISLPPAFDGYAERPARVTPSSLVTYDRNRYSVECSQVGRIVQMRVYADRIVVVSNGRVVGEHERHFGRNKTIFDPWHYVPALERKPGALRNGAPFKHWDLPQSMETVLNRLKNRYPDWDRQFVAILNAVPFYGLEAVSNACREALKMRAVSKEVVLNLLNRDQDHDSLEDLALSSHLILKQDPIADCRRYERLLREGHHAAQ